MRKASIVKGVGVWLAMLGFCLPESVFAAVPPAGQPPVAVDVALKDGGLLLGQVVDPKGTAIPNTPVSLRHENQQIGMSKTDNNGTFAFREVRGGVHQVAAAESFGTYRLWAPGTAPPTAGRSALVVTRTAPVRAPILRRGLAWLSNPWVVAGVVAAAIAVPIAVWSGDEKGSASP